MSVFKQEGTSNVSWTWTMTDWAFETTDERAADNWYPGDDVVDVIGADAYNFSDCMTAGHRGPRFALTRSHTAWARYHLASPSSSRSGERRAILRTLDGKHPGSALRDAC